MMQRDEETLLNTWFRCYNYLLCLDNRSMNLDVIATLKKYGALGNRVYLELDRVGDFEGKRFHFTNVTSSWDHDPDYNFAIPLDCDEFLAVFMPHGLFCDHQTIHNYLDELSVASRRSASNSRSTTCRRSRAGSSRNCTAKHSSRADRSNFLITVFTSQDREPCPAGARGT